MSIRHPIETQKLSHEDVTLDYTHVRHNDSHKLRIMIIKGMTSLPIPNVLVSLLIGIANETFVQVLVSSLGWGFVWIVYSYISNSVWIEDFIQKAIVTKSWSYQKSKLMAFVVEYFSITLMTVLPLSSLIFVIKISLQYFMN